MKKKSTIYKFCSFNLNSLKILLNSQLYLGQPNLLNDLYEGEFEIDNLTSLPENNVIRKICQHFNLKADNLSLNELNALLKYGIKEKLDLEYGISCFTNNITNPLMWAHYADSMKGMCIEFDEELLFNGIKESTFGSNIQIVDVAYSKQLPKVTINFKSESFEYIFDDRELYFTKQLHWKYEKEKRLVWRIPEHHLRREVIFNSKAILKIIVGEKMPIDQRVLLQNILDCPKLKHIQLYVSERNMKNKTIAIRKRPLILLNNIYYPPNY